MVPIQAQDISLFSSRIIRLAIPSNAEYSVPQLRFMLKEVEAVIGRAISNDEWVRL
jgi:hypothetical protein